MYMQGLANFIDDFLGGLILIGYSLIVGGLLWCWSMFRVWADQPAVNERIVKRSVFLIRAGALAMAVMQGIKLVIKGVVLWGVLGELPFDAYVGTEQFQAGVARFILASVIALVCWRLMRQPLNRSFWNLLVLATVPLVVAGAWLVHAVGRFEFREPLMLATILHQFAAAVWFGGVVHLLALWHLGRSDPDARAFWGDAVLRFGGLGMAAVALLILTGLPLAIVYVASWQGLFGTGYGSLVVMKIILFAVALGFAFLNHRAGRMSLASERSFSLNRKVPFFIEAETFILIGVLFIAATLSSQPPSEDLVHNKEMTASISEVAAMFTPRLPELHSPSHAELMAGEAGRVAVVNKVPSVAATEWSNYNHNVSGLFLTAMGLLAMVSYIPGGVFRMARYWPIGFVGLSIFLFFRSDAETWPLGPIGFWESTFGNGEVFQHRIATIVAFVLGVMEIRARTAGTARKLRYVFPMLCAFGGILLLTHAHAEFEPKSEFLIQSTHTTMGLLAMLMAAGRWLELRLAGGGDTASAVDESCLEGRVAGFIAVFAMFLIGLILLVYREPLF